MKIRFFSSFGDARTIPDTYVNLHNLTNTGYDFTNGDDYTHVIILNTAMPQGLLVPKTCVIGLAFEPPQFLGITQEFIQYATEHIGTYYIGELQGLPEPFKEGYGYLWHTSPPPPPLHEKIKFMSIMVSEKKHAPGHQYRHRLVYEILKTDLPIDIYGRGCMYYKDVNDRRLKGVFTGTEPYIDYRYHIAIENFQTPHYFSEKISDPLLHKCTPVYLGCKNIDSYFKGYVVHLDGDLTNDILLLYGLLTTKRTIPNTDNILKILSFDNVVNLLLK
jgi:hypothetical protein